MTVMASQTFKAKDLPIESVTVFTERAEVTRVARVELQEGLNKITVNGLVAKVIEDTVRVDGKGDAVIQEVQFHSKKLKEDEYCEELRKLREEQKNYQYDLQRLREQKSAMSQRSTALNRMADQNPVRIQEAKELKEGTIVVPYDTDAVEKISQFFDLYEAKMDELNKRISEWDKKIEDLQKKELELNEKVRDEMVQSGVMRAVTILLECAKACTSVLEIRYQVRDAAWQPAYDIRVKTTNEGEQRLKLLYQGKITQTTGEDWINSRLILSTTNPCQGVLQLHQLDTLNVTFDVNQIVRRPEIRHQGMMLASNVAWASQSEARAQGVVFGAAREELQDAGFAEAAVDPDYEQDRSFAAVFNIDRAATIPSDSGEHKVTITTLEVVPRIVYKAIPKVNCNVFITALTRNETAFPFLEGNAAVHFNNSFISISRLNRINPGEKFSCNLGIDPSVVISYGSLNKTTSEVGPIAKIARVASERNIVVQNLKKKEVVTLMLQEHIPKSSEQRIQVNIISPEITKIDKKAEEIEPGAQINNKNNLEWTVVLQPGETKRLHLSINIDHPIGETIRFYNSK